MQLRSYQQQAVDGAFEAWKASNSTLIVMPTGTGKTVVLSHIIKRRPRGKALLLAHREELIWQGASKIEKVTGHKPGIEMAEFAADTSLFGGSDVVVSTIQTQGAGEGGEGRMSRFDPHEFALLIVDEAHHAVAKSYRRVIDYYRQNPDLKVLGVTATPDRADEEALGQIFESVAFEYELPRAIDDGWLVPIRQRAVYVEGLDYSSVRTHSGDLNGTDLARVLEYEETLQRIVAPTAELIGRRKALVFAASVAQAARMAEIFNRYDGTKAAYICGNEKLVSKELRRKIVADFASGTIRVLVNVGVATEGFDDPGIEVVVMARPTKSRALYAQMAGRGTRPLAGIVDAWPTPQERIAAIAASAKPCVEIIDFVGNCGRHRLITTADILGGNYSDEVVERARKKAESSGGEPVDMTEALADEEKKVQEEQERAQRAGLRVKARYTSQVSNPFEVLGLQPWQERGWNKGRLPSEKQLAFLERSGVPTREVTTFTQARQLIDTIISRRATNGCTFKQAALLSKFGYPTRDVSFDQAKATIDRIAASGWRRPGDDGPPPAPAVKVY